MFFRVLLLCSCLLAVVQPSTSLAEKPKALAAKQNECTLAPAPRTAADFARWEEWPGYWEKIGELSGSLPSEPDSVLLMPVQGVQPRHVANTYMALRPGGRRHEGQDIFARRGTPVYSATEGYLLRIDYGPLGGLQLYVLGGGGRRYYYAHFDRLAPNLQEGQKLTTATLLGYVGNSGMAASSTPPHLHFGIYEGSRVGCNYRPLNPLPLFRERNWRAFKPEVHITPANSR